MKRFLINNRCIHCPFFAWLVRLGVNLSLKTKFTFKVENSTLHFKTSAPRTGEDCSSTLEVWRSIGTAVETLYISKHLLQGLEKVAALHWGSRGQSGLQWRQFTFQNVCSKDWIEALHFKTCLQEDKLKLYTSTYVWRSIETTVEASLHFKIVSLEDTVWRLD